MDILTENVMLIGEKMNLPDVQQNKSGFKKKAIQKVGVRNIKIPFRVATKQREVLNTIATISSYCNLVEGVKGINMSRIARTINEAVGVDSAFGDLNEFIEELQIAHGVDDIYIKAEFDYIVPGKSPLSEINTYEPCKVSFESKLVDGELKDYLVVESVEMSLCPCSKEMSLLYTNLTEEEEEAIANANLTEELTFKLRNAGFGAHNQRSIIKVEVEINRNADTFWIEDIIQIIKNGASSPTWSALKRPDEKWVTEVSYMGGYFDEDKKFVEIGGGPKFVEDIARDVASELDKELDVRINDYLVIVNNEESIHTGKIMATAVLRAGRSLV
jgi:GTP cyclohydrolase IB